MKQTFIVDVASTNPDTAQVMKVLVRELSFAFGKDNVTVARLVTDEEAEVTQ